ncbi:MAG: serine/threonine protein kinase [Gemmataceae bacterium]|nr:serine/threonine protein kinase [Gemmataceae bacterium]MCI0741291.1 serine/threonine protein kinase [Gemmataceae bacterium]
MTKEPSTAPNDLPPDLLPAGGGMDSERSDFAKTVGPMEQTHAFGKAADKQPVDFEVASPREDTNPTRERGNDSAKSERGNEPAPVGHTKQMSKAEVDAVHKAAQAKSATLGDYLLQKKIGQGGMGAVYKAHQISLDRDAAVKVLSKELAAKPGFIERFLREARVMAKLDHPHILRCYDVDVAGGYHYLAMEYVDGGSADDLLREHGKLSLGDALHIALKTAVALQHAHDQGLVHRDIKPDNILLTKKGVVKVADLGLAKATDDDMTLTKTGTGAGTPLFMAPEQARDVKHVDGRVDIYALGCMLYAFLTGDAPFKGETFVELIEAKERGKYTPIRNFNQNVPERLDLIVEKMVAKKPEHRYASCAELIAELEALGLHHEALSVVEGAAAPSQLPLKTLAPAPAPATKMPAVAAATQSPTFAQRPDSKADRDFYFWQFIDDTGQLVTKKLKREQVVTLIKSGSVDAAAQMSRGAAKGNYRALGTYVEFAQLFKGMSTKEQADRKTEKIREMYKQIEKEEEARLRWRWIHNLYLRAGGFLGFVLWLCVLAGVAVGGFFLIRWLVIFIGEKISRAGQL